MKFITEYDLRVQFNEQPFTDYQIEKNTRLTPGARQFLSDRRINFFEAGAKQQLGVPPGNSKTQERNYNIHADSEPWKEANSKKNSLSTAKLQSYIEILEAEFFVITSQLIEVDIEIAGRMSKAGHEFGRIKALLTEEPANCNICFEGCTGMKQENCGKDLGNCFEITDFYIQSANGKIIVQINALRAKLRAIRIHIAEVLSALGEEKRLIAVTEAINQIINKLSQMICMAAGVKECRRMQ